MKKNKNSKKSNSVLNINDPILEAIRSKYVPSSNHITNVEDIFKDRKRFERSNINGLNIKESDKIVYLIRYIDENDNLEYEEERDGYVDSFLTDKTNVYIGNDKYRIVHNEDIVGVYKIIDNTKKIQFQEKKLIELKEQLESTNIEEDSKEQNKLQNKINRLTEKIENLYKEDGTGIVTWIDGYEQIDIED